MMVTMRPVMAIARRARNLKNMKRSPVRVVSFVDIQLSAVTKARARREIPFMVHIVPTLVLGRGSADFEEGAKARTTYSPNIMAIMAAEPGLRTKTEDHVKRKPNISPKIFER